MKFKLFYFFLTLAGIIILHSCSSTKYVPQGEYWLENATVKADVRGFSSLELEPYIQQRGNFKTFALFRLPLFIYNLSGSDTTKWINRVLRSGGEAPVIYDSTMVDKTVDNLSRLMINKGYVNARVVPDIEMKQKSVKIKYNIYAGEPYRITDYYIEIPDTVFENNPDFPFLADKNRTFQDSGYSDIDNLLMRNTLVEKDALFDLDVLDEERDRVSSVFRRIGYYKFDKEYIGYIADTTHARKNNVELEMTAYPYLERQVNGEITEEKHKQYTINEVRLYVDYNPLEDGDVEDYNPTQIVYRNDSTYKIYYGERGVYIKPHAILNNCFIFPGMLYNEESTTMTYNSFSQLHILRNVNIRYEEAIENDSTKLNCIITCVPDKRQAITIETEGTNSGKNFGVGASIGYLHRNLFRGSELFNAKVYGSYEALDASFASFHKNYFEIGGETSITFPRFMFPFLKRDLRRRLNASTQLTANYTYQRRPGYFTRTILSSSLGYSWNNRRSSNVRHNVDLINVSYVHIPEIDSTFAGKLTEAARRFSFTDQFILGSGYTYTNSNYNIFDRNKLKPVYSFRASVETAGNLLSLIASVSGAEKDDQGSKKVFGTRFVQYISGNTDYSRTIPIDEKNKIAWRLGGGVIYPYGNYKMVPIQKRFFSGGANSVRGWPIRELGPGSFYREGSTFYDHSGEIRFDANIEYRSRVFWKVELAAFLDAGNIWTIKKYEQQEKGNFNFKTFYKEIASAWGLGFRLDFDYVLIRLDCGWKLYDPADVPKRYIQVNGENVPDPSAGYKSKWPVLEPWKIGKNTAWHIAVGYPF